MREATINSMNDAGNTGANGQARNNGQAARQNGKARVPYSKELLS
jgi:hypothetical protein